ncbi:uncharacterized protein J3D65DRAFT_624723 [Phyllosticta citribraziliensis]|uniref:Outer spore wall protein RRT8 n=1 Tax=Phyllosticta citribraziliensis TaxID=989973 RepID=A0ABR1LT46_9PEZI
MASRLKDMVLEEATRVRRLTIEAARAGTYLYPIRGIFYFMTHRSLWKPLTSHLGAIISTGVGVTTFMFFFTYLPQAAVLTLVNGPLAALTTILLVLSESSTISNIVCRGLWVEEAVVDTFDGTLVTRDQTTLLSHGRALKPSRDPISALGAVLSKPFKKLSPTSLLRSLIYLPLNLLPVIGPLLYILAQGRKRGPELHARYFQLKEWSPAERRRFVDARAGAYAGFGVAAVALELVPVVGLFFAFTNAVGAALWAAELEERGSTAPGLKAQAEAAKKAE